MFLLIDLPEQRVELFDQLVHVSLAHLTALPPLHNAVAQQQPQETAEYPATDEERYGHVLCSFPLMPLPMSASQKVLSHTANTAKYLSGQRPHPVLPSR